MTALPTPTVRARLSRSGPVVALNASAASWSTAAPAWRLEPVTILRVALVLLCVSNLARLPVAEAATLKAPIILNDILAGLMIVSAAIVALRHRSLVLDDVSFAALAFAAVGGLSAVSAVPRFDLAAFELVLSLAYLARWLLYLTVYVIVINYVRGRDVDRVWSALETGVLLFAAFGIIQSIFLPNFAQILYPDSIPYVDHDPQGHRLVSTILDPNLAAAYILTALMVHLGQISAGAKVAMWKTLLLLVAIVLTLSRSAMLALFVGGVTIVAVRGIGRTMLKFGGLGVVALLALSPRILDLADRYSRLTISDSSAYSRVIGWTRALETFLDSPWFGIGFNTYGFVQERRGVVTIGIASYSVEGGLLFIAVMTGVVGLALYGTMLWRVVRRCRTAWRLPAATPAERGFLVGVGALTVAMVVDSIFVNSLLTPSTMEPMLVLWGLAFVIARHVRQRSAAA